MLMRIGCCVALSVAVSGCGTSYTRLTEVWDRVDPDATFNLERQVKNAIRCELVQTTRDIRRMPNTEREQRGKLVSTPEDYYFPDTWGVLIQLTLQADEKSSLTPGVSLKTPFHNAPVNFPGEVIGATGALAAITYGPISVAQNYATGLGGQLSTQNIRFDKYNFYWTAKDLAQPPSEGSSCRPGFDLGPRSSSSPLLDASNLGIRDWLTSAVRVIDFHRSSRQAESGEGKPLGVQGTASDSSTYSNKFILISSASVTPTWNLVRIGTSTSPLFDANRTRSHELIMTVGPGATAFEKSKMTGRLIAAHAGPSASMRDSHNAALIGSAVANSLRQQ